MNNLESSVLAKEFELATNYAFFTFLSLFNLYIVEKNWLGVSLSRFLYGYNR